MDAVRRSSCRGHGALLRLHSLTSLRNLLIPSVLIACIRAIQSAFFAKFLTPDTDHQLPVGSIH